MEQNGEVFPQICFELAAQKTAVCVKPTSKRGCMTAALREFSKFMTLAV